MQKSMEEHQRIRLSRGGYKRNRFTPFILALPGLALLGLVLAYPILRGLVMSLYDTNLASFSPPSFIGLNNYINAFTSPNFLEAFWHTLYIVAVSISFEFLIGLALAQLFNQNFFGRNFLRGIVLLPWMTAPVVVALMWSQLFNETYGLINYLLANLGLISSAVHWLTSPLLALHVVIAVDIWRETPFVMIVLLAGLQGINGELYEAATIDGAGLWQRFRFITLPLLKPAIALALLMRTMIALRFFDIVWIMTHGGPAGATEVLGTHAYTAAFVGFRLGYGSAVATVIFLLAFAISLIYIRVLQRERAT